MGSKKTNGKKKKSSAAASKPKALLYGFDAKTDGTLRSILAACSVEAICVTDAQLGEKVGKLLAGGKAGKQPANVQPSEQQPANAQPSEQARFGDPFLLLSDLSDRRLNELLAAMRAGGVSAEYKAVATETNRRWQLGELMREVRKEHLLMKMQEKV